MQLDERRQRLIKSFCAKGPVYENCRMLSHDGTPLSFIDYRKLIWYEVRPIPLSWPYILCLSTPLASCHGRAAQQIRHELRKTAESCVAASLLFTGSTNLAALTWGFD